MSNSPKTLIVYHYIAKYRKPIFSELVNSGNFFIASDVVSNNDIELTNIDFPNDKFIALKNTWLGKKVLWQLGLISHVITGKYDSIIYLGDPNFITTWICLILNKFMKTRSYLWTHGFVHKPTLSTKLKIIMYRLSDGLLLYGNNSKNKLIERGISEEKLHVIYNSLDFSNQKSLKSKINKSQILERKNSLFKSNHFQLVFVGRLTFHKKLDMLIELVDRLKGNQIYVNLLLIGDGEARTTLEKMVANKPSLLEQVNFYGKTYDESELCELLLSSDLCISPGEIGLTAMHVMGYGIPVITHDNFELQMPEYEAIIENKTGILFEEGSIDSLVNTVVQYINNPILNVDEKCIEVIEKYYSPESQLRRINKALKYDN
ncbi:glycosyltransferase [Vibrio sp. RC27]